MDTRASTKSGRLGCTKGIWLRGNATGSSPPSRTEWVDQVKESRSGKEKGLFSCPAFGWISEFLLLPISWLVRLGHARAEMKSWIFSGFSSNPASPRTWSLEWITQESINHGYVWSSFEIRIWLRHWVGKGVSPKADDSTNGLKDSDSNKGKRGSTDPKNLRTLYVNGPQ